MDTVVKFSDNRNNKINQEIEVFARAMSKKKQSAEYYVENRNASLNNVGRNIALGKKGEYFAFKFLVRKYGYPVIPMDTEIREGSNKGWRVDLNFKDFNSSLPNIHVKTCDKFTVSYSNDFSWLLQWSNARGKGGKDKIFFDKCKDDIIMFVYTDHYRSDTGIIKHAIPVRSLDRYLKEPKKKDFQGRKKGVYYKDLVSRGLEDIGVILQK